MFLNNFYTRSILSEISTNDVLESLKPVKKISGWVQPVCLDLPILAGATTDPSDQEAFVFLERWHIVELNFNYPIVVTVNRSQGTRCGYMGVPSIHPWFNHPPKEKWGADGDDWTQSFWEYYVRCHGGVTYDVVSMEHHWVGFDCNHHGDGQDKSLMNESSRAAYDAIHKAMDRVSRYQTDADKYKPPNFKPKSLEYCLSDLRDMVVFADQAIKGNDLEQIIWRRSPLSGK